MTSSNGESATREGSFMDERLWGMLQNHIDLSMIYAKLPNDAFFRLRAVCKDWNRLASDPIFLRESSNIPTLNFLVDGPMCNYRLLTYDSSSRRWNWTHGLPRADIGVGDLLLTRLNAHEHSVFNIQTRTVQTLPSLPPVDPERDLEHALDDTLIGMTVDTSVNPPSFRVILGHKEIGTRIYDSTTDSWSTDSLSMVVEWEPGQDSIFAHSDPTCVEFCGVLYIRLWGMYGEDINVYTYMLEDDWWSGIEQIIPNQYDFHTFDIGAWADRLFLFGMRDKPAREFVAWSRSERPNWTLFDRMPEDLYEWMQIEYEDLDRPSRDVNAKYWPCHQDMEIRTKFCGEYVLVFKCLGLADVAERAILYNLDSKVWQKVGIPKDDTREETEE
ncbi:hypothetical protein M758_8G163600 [Ceratodon purpureus]|nr:hypothetical protein M758_8G163600 [Ceratodon purpureus]